MDRLANLQPMSQRKAATIPAHLIKIAFQPEVPPPANLPLKSADRLQTSDSDLNGC
jgi:hypothetical protein